ncbi:hypothetical protein [Moorena sp. SIO3H5]|uniref:hypothetical protein n=1 Tax=Moorena sp. SIO3H5 TaxID=2607834 RepID=UPI0013B6E6E1|nr:hypothetical protein [Moorena sp. SIO3H5]NEO70975.1 hypothetical protein [Moorena sp. SIO3H5]
MKGLGFTEYSVYHSYEVHIIFYLFPHFPSWEGLGVGSSSHIRCSLLPYPLLPAPCSLLPKTQRFVPHGYNNCYRLHQYSKGLARID